MNEFQLINYLTRGFKKDNNNVIKSIGDDTAVVQYNKDKYILLTTDSLVENIHFKLDYKINNKKLWYFLGWKAIAVNVSDIFAMGGKPSDALVSLNIPKNIKNKLLKILYSGLKNCADKYKVRIVGGNVTKSNYDFIISVTLTGIVDKDKLLLRETARNGDYIYTQNGIGNAKAGLELLLNGSRKLDTLILSHLKPEPRINWGELQDKYKINSAIDISDGLLQDVMHILESSNKGAEIYTKDLSADDSLKNLFPENYLEYMLYGGEDYKIVFTSSDRINEKGIYSIGRINKKKGMYLFYKDKKEKVKNLKGYIHF